jgi:dephospho-CoA kinase
LKKWQDKFVIGLTGNIGTGKSVVRRMLEHLGAYGIDADALSHRAMQKGAPAFEPIVEAFGRYILDADGEIDRGRLGRLVFSDPDALAQLENIIHPMVEQAVDLIIRRSSQKVIVIEAIKLLESNLADYCDNIWVVYSPPEIQLHRLTNLRGMHEKDARQRLASQIPQENRLARASVVIKNVSTFEDTWRQVTTAWQRHVPQGDVITVTSSQPVQLPLGEVNVIRATPRQADEVKEVFNTLGGPNKDITHEEVMAAFGEKAFMLLKVEKSIMGILGWQVENLVSRTIDILLDPVLPPAQYLPIMIREMERAAGNLQCEASLVFAPSNLAMHDALWKSLGYEQKTPAQLGARAWQDAAEELLSPNAVLFFKQLRIDRVLRPI